MTKTGPSTDIYLDYPQGRPPSRIELWVEGATPLVLDAFAVHLITTPFATSLINAINLNTGGTTRPLLLIAALMVSVTFTMHLLTHQYMRRFVNETGVCGNPLFRAVWVFICANFVTGFTTGGGVMPFTIVAFVPFIYIRVRDQLAACASVYALVFLLFTARHSFLLAGTGWSFEDRPARPIDSHDIYLIFVHMCVFILSSLYHSAWFTSHTYTSDTTPNPVRSYYWLRWRHSAIPIATFRATVVLLSMLSGDCGAVDDASTRYNYHIEVKGVRMLFLFIAISTYTAWTHCQHNTRNPLQTILSASVIAATFGMLVQNIEQILFVWLFFCVAISIDTVSSRARGLPKCHGL